MKNTSPLNIEFLNLKDVNRPYEDDIRQALSQVTDSGWYLYGHNVKRFEQDWAEYCGAKYCVACGNGLDALTLVLKAWQELGRIFIGDEVIVPANTYIATILAVSECGLIPVLVEPDPETYLISANSILNAITERTRAILPVHLYGQMCDMEQICSIAKEKNLLVLEDCAQAHGNCRLNGTCAWSFYPSKNLGALGDAGAVTSDDEELASAVRKIANYGSGQRYVNDYKGINSRMDEFQAAILSIKLKDLDRCNAKRKVIAERYNNEIRNPHIVLPRIKTESVYHLYTIRCERREELLTYLREHGIATQIHYPIPPHKQTAYREWNNLSFPITEHIADTILSIPCNQTMTDEEVEYIIEVLTSFIP